MKVTRESELIGLEQQNAQANKTQKANSVDFAKLLEDQIRAQTSSGEGMTGVGLINTTTTVSNTKEGDSLQKVSGDLLKSIEDSMSIFTTYTESLATNKKNAWAQLDGVGSKLSTLRKENPDLATENPMMHSVLSEMEILATTEKYKFNRGDYM